MHKFRVQGSASIIVIIVLVAAILGAVGYTFWQNSTQRTPANNATQNQSSQYTKTKTPAEQEVATPPYTLANATEGITKALALGECTGNGSALKESDFIVVNDTDPFVYKGGKSLMDKGFTYAYVQYGCGSQGIVALLKKTKSSWSIVTEDARIYPLCDQIRGQGFPTSIIDKCYDNERSSEPVSIN